MRAFAASIAGSRYGVLSRAFFGQFFASEAVTSDVQMQKAAVGVLAFLLKTLWFYLFTRPDTARLRLSAQALGAAVRRDFTGHERFLR